MAFDMNSAYAFFTGQRGAAAAGYAPAPVYAAPQPAYVPAPVYQPDAYNGFNAQLAQIQAAMASAAQQVRYAPAPQPVYWPQQQPVQLDQAINQANAQLQNLAYNLQINMQQAAASFQQGVQNANYQLQQGNYGYRRY